VATWWRGCNRRATARVEAATSQPRGQPMIRAGVLSSLYLAAMLVMTLAYQLPT
jgi:hypothetical protein